LVLGKVVVHGCVLRCYTTIQALVTLGVKPENIVFVTEKQKEELVSWQSDCIPIEYMSGEEI